MLDPYKKRRVAFVRCYGLIAALLWAGMALASDGVDMRLEDGGRRVTLIAPGMTAFRGGFSATLSSNGQQRELLSTNGVPTGSAEPVTENTPYGVAELTATMVRFENEHIDLLLRFGRVPGVMGLVMQAGIRNTGKESINLLAVKPIAMTGRLVGNPADWFVTSLVPNSQSNASVVAAAEIREPLLIEEYGGFYRRDGTGFLFGPVGTPVSFLYTTIMRDEEGQVSFSVGADMSGVRVEPGETRWGQQVALLMSPPRQALACWTEWVAKTHGARTDKGALSGWSSWYFLGREVTGKDVLEVAKAAVASPDRLRPNVILIDHGYRTRSGKNEPNAKFPEGLAFYAQQIAASGAKPGLRLSTPPWSLEDKHVLADLLDQSRWAIANGFTCLRFNVKFKNEPFAVLSPTSRQTSFEAVREFFSVTRKEVGPSIYLMCCDKWPYRAAIGYLDASGIGASASRSNVRQAMNDVLRSYQLNGRWFAVDNDGFFMGADIANVSRIEGGWPLVRTWMSMVGLSCGTAMTSDPWHLDNFKPYWQNVEVMTPVAKEQTEVLDLFTRTDWPRLVGHVRRDWGGMTVALLWNPAAIEQTVKLDFSAIGLDPLHRFAVWSFWDNRYLGVTKGTWTTPALAPSASQHLRFTDLDQTPDKPVLIGSSLHIYCGASEIKRVVSRSASMEIELTDAGARDGDLFVYSRLPLVLKGAVGCTVTGIASAGEYVWRISMVDRQCGVSQRVMMEVMLPVTRQAWFWLLIALVITSLLFTAWRYAANLSLQREHALEQERARIARDLHDDLGAGLTEITMLSDMARLDCDQPAAVNAHLGRIFQSGIEMAQALDEIVWAVNPSNDTLDKLISFSCEFAQGILESAGIRCRLDVPASVPRLNLNSKTRHQLCMALKECLHNIVKHAHAQEVCMSIRLNGQMLDMSVSDDGVGFDPGILQNKAGTHDGLFNLRQRLADIGGTCEIHSAPGQGTQVTWRVRI
jgi:signal transduction histidine kinase